MSASNSTEKNSGAKMRWDHTVIKTDDLERAMHFYCDILGLRQLEIMEVLD